MSSEDTWHLIATEIVPVWQRRIFSDHIETCGQEILSFYAKLISSEDMEPLAIILKVQAPSLLSPAWMQHRWIFHNKPVKLEFKWEMKEL